MDEDTADLIRQLYTRVGMALEDAGLVALTLGSPRSTFDPEKVAELDVKIEQAGHMLKAAHSLHE
jgi:hypothetical protein